MSLEDFCEDIINKAQNGLKISDAELCSKAGISKQSLEKVKQGHFDEKIIRQIASFLKLDADNLVISGKKAWEPKTIEIDGVKQYVSNYLGMLVNAYLIWDPETLSGVIFDTGSDAKKMIEAIEKLKIIPEMLLLTHSHGDHIADMGRIHKAFPNLRIGIHKKELIEGAEGIMEGREFKVGKLKIQTRRTSGHSVGGLTYVVEGLERLVAVVGDALFAGSMGGASLAYEEALENNIQQILSLPEETIICPGHGPMTTVKEEKEHNPFYSNYFRK